MPEILVRLNLPGFHSPDPFHLTNAPSSLTGLACAVLQEIGGFSKEELEGVRNNHDMPLTILGELCAGQLVPLVSDAELDVFLANADSPSAPAIIEVRSRDVAQDSKDTPAGNVRNVTAERSPDASNGKVDTSVLHHGGRQPVSDVRSSPSKIADVNGHSFESRAPVQVRAKPDAQPQQQIPPMPAPQAVVFTRGSEDLRQHPQQQSLHSSQNIAPSAVATTRMESFAQYQQPQQQQQSSLLPASHFRPQVSEAQVKSRSSSRSSTPICEHTVTRNPPVHVRLYQEKDSRRRRQEEARLRRLEEEDEELRYGASMALGRASSPVRSQSPARTRGAYRAPIRPPLPERSTNNTTNNNRVSRVGVPTTTKTMSRPSSATVIGRHNRKMFEPQPRKSFSGSYEQSSPPRLVGDGSNSIGLSHISGSPGQSTSALVQQDSSSIASDYGQVGPSVASVGEESGCAERVDSSPVGQEDLRQLVTAHEQRIEFLENMHQQALRQLRKSREEIAIAQQQRFREADKVLRLEQLVSEMQARRFEGDVVAQQCWEESLARLRAVFEDERD